MKGATIRHSNFSNTSLNLKEICSNGKIALGCHKTTTKRLSNDYIILKQLLKFMSIFLGIIIIG